jgi:hypothetical protein
MNNVIKSNICFFMHAVAERVRNDGLAFPPDAVVAATEEALCEAEREEAMCLKEGMQDYENPEAMYQAGQDWARDNLKEEEAE